MGGGGGEENLLSSGEGKGSSAIQGLGVARRTSGTPPPYTLKGRVERHQLLKSKRVCVCVCVRASCQRTACLWERGV